MFATLTKKILSPKSIVIIFGALIFAGVILQQSLLPMVVLLIFFVPLSFFVLPHVAIPVLLVARSSLDIFTNVGFHIGPMILNVPSITSLFLLIGGSPYLFAQYAIKKQIDLNKVGKTFLLWLIALLLWVFVAYMNFGTEGLVSLREWTRLASLFVIYMLIGYLTKRNGFRKVINYFFWALPVPLVVGAHQILTNSGIKVDQIRRIYGTMAHPNSFSLFLVLFIGLTLWRARLAKRKFLWFALLAVEVVVLVNTFSVGGMIMLVVLSAILMTKAVKARQRSIIFLLATITIISFALSPAGRSRITELSRMGNVRDVIESGKMSGEGSVAWRMLNWYLFTKEWRAKPIFGFGLSTTGELVSPLKNVPHNDYLRFLVETGIVGFAIYLVFLVITGQEIWKTYRFLLTKDRQLSYLALTLFSIYSAWIVGSFADNYITATVFQYYFWGLMGILMAMRSLPTRTEDAYVTER